MLNKSLLLAAAIAFAMLVSLPVRAEDPTDDTPKHHIEVDNETTHGAVFIGIVDPATDEGWQYDLTDFKHQDGVAPTQTRGYDIPVEDIPKCVYKVYFLLDNDDRILFPQPINLCDDKTIFPLAE